MRDADVAAMMMNRRQDGANASDCESLDLLREGNLVFKHMRGTIAWLSGDATPAQTMEWLQFADGSEIVRLRRSDSGPGWGGWAVVPSLA